MLKLVYNEWIKIFKRVGTYVMIALVLIGVIGNGALTKYYESKVHQPSNKEWRAGITQQIKADEQNIKDLPKSADKMKKHYEQQIEINQYRLDHNIPLQINPMVTHL